MRRCKRRLVQLRQGLRWRPRHRRQAAARFRFASPFRIFLHSACASGSLPSANGQIVGRRTAVERLAEGLHALRNGEITDPHFAQIGVHILAEAVEQRLAQLRPALDRPQPPQYHPQMQHQQVKTAVNRIRHAQVPIKQRFSRLRHDHAIDGLNGAAQGHPGFPEVIERPKHCGFRKRAPKVSVLGARACCNPACCPVRQRLARCKGTGPVPE